MTEMINISRDELEQLRERARKLALEKSYLQLVNNLITQLSSVPGLEKTVESIVKLILNSIGGTNVSLYYQVDTELLYVDVYGKIEKLTGIDDDLVKRVFDTREFIEIRNEFAETKMQTPEFTKSSDWALPLVVGDRLMGVLKMKGMLLSAAEVREQLKAFFSYSALVLKNEIENYSRLKESFDQVQQMNEQLAQEITVRKEAENSLKITQFAVDHASDCLFWIRPDASFANANDSTCSRLGYSRDELLSMTVFDVDPAFPRQAWASHWIEIKERKSLTIETKHKTKSGEIFPVEVTVNYVEYDGAEYNFAFARDITERKRAEEDIRRANAKLEEMVSNRTAELETTLERLKAELEERKQIEEQLRITQFSVDSSADAIFWIRPDGLIKYANRAVGELLGYSNKEILRLKTFDLNPEHQGQAWQQHWKELRKQGALRFETSLTRKDGSQFPVEITANHVEFNEQEYNCAFVRDITERKKAEEEISRSSQEWSTAMDASGDVIYLLGLDRRVMRANKAFYMMTRSTPETAIGKHIVELVHPKGEKVTCPVCLAQEEKRDLVITMEQNSPDNPSGKPIEIMLKIARDDEGTPISMLMTLHDLTHERKLQEELAKYREHLEELVKERTAEIEKKNTELAKMNKVFVGRELRMIELKEKIRQLELMPDSKGAEKEAR